MMILKPLISVRDAIERKTYEEVVKIPPAPIPPSCNLTVRTGTERTLDTHESRDNEEIHVR